MDYGANCLCEFIEQVSVYKYLGVIIDENFNFAPHIENVINKVKCVIPNIYYIKSVVNESILRQIYFSLVHPFIIYGLVAWGFIESGAMTKLKKCQKKVLKIMKKSEIDPSINLFSYWKVLPVNLQAKHSLIYENYFNDIHGESRTHNYETRLMTHDQLITPRSVNRFGERLIDYILPRIWNELPSDLKCLSSELCVKKKVKEWLLSCL